MNDIRLSNKSDKPDNIVEKEWLLDEAAREIESILPSFFRPYFMYLKNSHAHSSRVEYLRDLRFFLTYLMNDTDLTSAKSIREITQQELAKVRGADVNIFLDYCRRYNMNKNSVIYVYQNSNKSLARKRSSLAVCFRYLFRNGMSETDITSELDPIHLPKAGDREIKTLEDGEVMVMLDAARSGAGLSKKEKEYWQKNKDRDYLMLMLFVTYGLRISELQQLNVDSFNLSRLEFKIYRKRSKETMMPLNRGVEDAFHIYVEGERETIRKMKAVHGEEALFLSLQGSRLTTRQIRDTVKKYTSVALQTSRGAGYSPHKLRATVATSLIERGHSIYDVQELLSHDNITTTQLYAAHRKGAKRDLVNDLEWGDE
ncbi:MAG: tyrosine-type recombinase/integrase [Clostridiales Family XIII bacterium]|nr:tyrosine-type recombinase/integrase [Clostridiales Family XIII bacterium]